MTPLKCPKCGKGCKNASGLASHMRIHKNAATPEQLGAFVDTGASVADIARELDVTDRTARLWLDRAGFADYRRDGKSQYICRHCGGEFKSGSGLSAHEKTCAKRPTDEKLEEMVEEGATLADFADQFNVRYEMVHQWLDEIGKGDYRVGMRETEKETLDLVIELAPMHGITGGCTDRLDNPTCPAFDECCDRLIAGLWVLCEAPERIDVAVANITALQSPTRLENG